MEERICRINFSGDVQLDVNYEWSDGKGGDFKGYLLTVSKSQLNIMPILMSKNQNKIDKQIIYIGEASQLGPVLRR